MYKRQDENSPFQLGKAALLREGSDVSIFATGIMVAEAVEAAELLAQEGKMCIRDSYTGLGMEGKKLGILGLGAIGKGVAKRAAGFSMDVYAYDPYFDEVFAAAHGVKKATLDEIFTQCDYITLHPVSYTHLDVYKRQGVAIQILRR